MQNGFLARRTILMVAHFCSLMIQPPIAKSVAMLANDATSSRLRKDSLIFHQRWNSAPSPSRQYSPYHGPQVSAAAGRDMGHTRTTYVHGLHQL